MDNPCNYFLRVKKLVCGVFRATKETALNSTSINRLNCLFLSFFVQFYQQGLDSAKD